MQIDCLLLECMPAEGLEVPWTEVQTLAGGWGCGEREREGERKGEGEEEQFVLIILLIKT